MKLLEQEYTLRGRADWRYRIVKREGDVVISEMHLVNRMKDEHAFTNHSLCGYEVFIVQKYQERERPDKKGMIPAKEMPPPDYHWGRYGHSFPNNDLASAMTQFEEEVENQRLLNIKREKRMSVI